MIKFVFVFSLLCLANSAFAQENTVKAYFVLNPMGDFIGTMKVISGSVSLQDGKFKGKNIVVDLKSLSTGMELRDDHAKNKYLDVKMYPTAILLEAVGANGVGKARIKVRDKESLVNGTYKVSSSGKNLKAEFKIKLSSFGIADVNFKGIGVEDEVRVEVVVPVVRGTDSATSKKAAAKAKPSAAAAPAAKPAAVATPAAKTTPKAPPSAVPPKK